MQKLHSNKTTVLQGDEVVGKVIELGYALERSAFTEFWALAVGCKDLLNSGAPLHCGGDFR